MKKKNRKNLSLAIGIFLLFVGIAYAPAIAQNTEKSLSVSRDSWLYVGGSGPGNYSKIQDAINNATDGDTVYVFDDSSPYRENIIINKKINLIGEDKNTTIIERSEQHYVIAVITTDFVIISGFTITSSKQDNYTGLQMYSSFHTISGNIFERNEMGIVIFTSSHSSEIYNNVFRNNSIGIDIKGSSCNDIFNNSFFSNWIGIVVQEGTGNTIANNLFIKREVGIHLGGNSNKIIDNVIVSQQWGIEISNCSDNEISNNSFSLNYYGIIIESNADNNLIQGNFLNDNLRNIKILSKCDYNRLEKNTIISSSHYGLLIEGSYNEIRYNLIKDNYDVGVEISGSYNNIAYNNIENNIKGIVLFPDSRYNNITFNNFIKNNGFFWYSLLQRRSHNIWDSNYWSSIIGNVKIIVGTTKILIISWYEGKEYHEIALYPKRFNFDWHPAQEPYDIPGVN